MKPLNIKPKLHYIILLALAASPSFAANKAKPKIVQPVNKELMLRPYIIAEGENITIGDIFYNAGNKSNIIIARAATNREKLIYNANSLQTRLSSFGINWANKEAVNQIIIFGKNANDNSPQNLQRRNLEISSNYYRLDEGARYYSNNSGNNNYGNNNSLSSPNFTYDNQKIEQIAVLNRNVEKGEIIDSSMISWIDTPKGAKFGIVKDAEGMIGKTATQNIDAMQPVKSYQLILPMAIKKGDNVTVITQMGNLTISMAGKALSDGAIGANVKVSNINSNKIIDAIVKSQGVAEVILAGDYKS